MHYLPIEPLLFGLFAIALVALAILIPLGALRYAYERIGLSPGAALLVLVATLLGSYVNVPLFQFPERHVEAARAVRYFGMRFMTPQVVDWPGTIVAANVGGAIIPTLLSVYLLMRGRFWAEALIATAIVALVCHALAMPTPGVGIAMPIFAPPLITAVVAMTVSWRDAAPLAYVAGCMGTLIGADISNLGVIPSLGASIASIGGAGTFDAVFLTGILAVLLAGIAGPPTRRA